ncbi:3-hydroxyacyl-CoA dehydrogenase family protein [Planctomycetaceae bacterium SH139]
MNQSPRQRPFQQITLVGAGVVGYAIAHAHLRAGCPVELVDNNPASLQTCGDALLAAGHRIVHRGEFMASSGLISLAPANPGERPSTPTGFEQTTEKLPTDALPTDAAPDQPTRLIIESILERAAEKRALFAELSQHFGRAAVLASNTSSLRIAQLDSAAAHPDLVCGLHFFMPVEGRDMVELISGSETSQHVLDQVAAHARRIGKPPLLVADSPGFLVNRLLWPYLNNAVRLLECGADHQAIRRGAERLGMPLSPLELIDMIGLRTAFDAGRAAWQAFPNRIEPSPILPGLIKRKLSGRSGQSGFYDYPANSQTNNPSVELNSLASQIIAKYQREVRPWTDDEVYLNLAVPMLIEALLVLREGVITERTCLEDALRAGLGWQNPQGFFGQFDASVVRQEIEQFSPLCAAMRAPEELLIGLDDALATGTLKSKS